jgi:hypothetical protein
MAPEQIEDAHAAGPEADVYALGAILFEILADENLHSPGELVVSTLEGTDISPSGRCPERDIAPELDALCITALARDPAKRPSARELADRIEGFLDGDRDVAARRRIVALELSEARAAIESGERAEAMQAAGRALALDPQSRDAADLVTTLMLEPPLVEPEPLRAQLATNEAAMQRRQGRVALASFLVLIAFLAISSWNGVLDWSVLGALVGVSSVLAVSAFVVSRRAMSSREILMTSWLVPVVLEWTGVLAQTWSVVGGAIVSTSSLFRIDGTTTVVLLVLANVVTIYVFGRFANTLARSRRDAQRQVEIQAWHLQQLLPRTD